MSKGKRRWAWYKGKGNGKRLPESPPPLISSEPDVAGAGIQPIRPLASPPAALYGINAVSNRLDITEDVRNEGSPVQIRLNFPGKCCVCKTDLDVGQQAYWYKGDRLVEGIGCHDAARAKPTRKPPRREYGTIIPVPTRNGENIYRIRYTDSTSERQSETVYGTREDAEMVLQNRQMEYVKQIEGAGGDMTSSNRAVSRFMCHHCDRTFGTETGRARHTGFSHKVSAVEARKILSLWRAGWSIKMLAEEMARGRKRIAWVIKVESRGESAGPILGRRYPRRNKAGNYRGMKAITEGKEVDMQTTQITNLGEEEPMPGYEGESHFRGVPRLAPEGESNKLRADAFKQFVAAYEHHMRELRTELGTLETVLLETDLAAANNKIGNLQAALMAQHAGGEHHDHIAGA